MCLVRWSFFTASRHIALSYVWGGKQGLQLIKSNESTLCVDGALKKEWNTIPALIRDAIELVRALNALDKEYDVMLWVDQLCIIQDDPKDKAIQIEQMGQTYSSAIATLIATEGSHSDIPLSRLHPNQDTVQFSNSDQSLTAQVSGPKQVVRNISGLRLINALSSINQTLERSTWNTRAWTMQEAELSHTSIIFADDQVHFRCATDVAHEDIVSEIPDLALKEIEHTKEKWFNSQAIERRLSPADNWDWPLTFDMYARIVRSYTARNMTFPTDILAAFRGTSEVMQALSAWKISNGLIEDVIDFTLLWRPRGVIHRRFRGNGDPSKELGAHDLGLPTYAWSAWHGPVTCQTNVLEGFISLIHRFETVSADNKKRHVVRYGQNINSEETGSYILNPKPPFAPQDCSFYKDVMQGLHWAKPMVRSLAYRARVVNNPHGEITDGPAILQFTSLAVKLLLSSAVSERQFASNESCKRVCLLDQHRRRVGTAWHVPLLEELDGDIEAIVLSKTISQSVNDSWQFDTDVGVWDEWCMVNVMLIKRLPECGLAERLTVGTVHAQCIKDGQQEMIRLV